MSLACSYVTQRSSYIVLFSPSTSHVTGNVTDLVSEGNVYVSLSFFRSLYSNGLEEHKKDGSWKGIC